MRSINKHDILRSWVENEVIDLSILVSKYDELTGQSASGSAVIDLTNKTITARIFNEIGINVLEFIYTGVENPNISVSETITKSKIILHFLRSSYVAGMFKASPAPEKWFELELIYAHNPSLTKHIFPHIAKDGTVMRFFIKLIQDRVS